MQTNDVLLSYQKTYFQRAWSKDIFWKTSCFVNNFANTNKYMHMKHYGMT